jgi:hypothetical protein
MTRAALGIIVLAAVGGAPPNGVYRIAPEGAVANDNRSSAGTLRGDVLTLRLEARQVEWRPEGDSRPGIVLRAFAEAGKPASVPGPAHPSARRNGDPCHCA